MNDKQHEKTIQEDVKALKDENLKDVNGGYENFIDQKVYCPNCNISDESNFSYQFWATWLTTRTCISQIYQCKNCKKYVATIKNGNGYTHCINLTEEQVDQYMKDSFIFWDFIK